MMPTRIIQSWPLNSQEVAMQNGEVSIKQMNIYSVKGKWISWWRTDSWWRVRLAAKKGFIEHDCTVLKIENRYHSTKILRGGGRRWYTDGVKGMGLLELNRICKGTKSERNKSQKMQYCTMVCDRKKWRAEFKFHKGNWGGN